MLTIDISRLPYKHRFAAASMLMAKGHRLTGLMSMAAAAQTEKEIAKALEGLSYYDMALALIKRHDPNYQTLLNWKCQTLIALGQFEDATAWYQELIQIEIESEGPDHLGATALLAREQIARWSGLPNRPLPRVDRFDVDMFDDPPFCLWAEQFCRLLTDRKFKDAHRCLAADLRRAFSRDQLRNAWTSLTAASRSDLRIVLERFEMTSSAERPHRIGWCYFSVVSDEINEAISLEIIKTEINAYEIGALDLGRP